MADDNVLQTSLKTLHILKIVSDSGAPISMTEVAARSELSTSIAFRSLKTLEVAGFVELLPGTKRYRATVNQAGGASLSDALDLFRRISRSPASQGATVDGLYDGSELSKPQIEKALADLTAARLIETRETGHWTVSPAILGYAQRILVSSPTLTALRPIMERLRDETGESVTWFRETNGFQVAVEVYDSNHPLKYTLPVGSEHSVMLGAGGRAWFMGQHPDRTAEIFDRLASQSGHKPLVTRDAFLNSVATFRAQGYAYGCNERIENAAAVAVPVRGPTGNLAGVLSIMAPVYRLSEAEARPIGKRVNELTQDIFGTQP